eukprot:RCo040998
MRAAFRAIKVELRRSTQWITLNTPENFNAVTDLSINELRMAFKTLDLNTTKAVVLTGEGSAFSSGVDLQWVTKMRQFSREEHLRESYALFDMLYAIWSSPVPVIARINGDVQGGGVGIVAACDFTFSARSARFSCPEVRHGLIPSVISPFVVNRIGQRNAMRLMLTAETISADGAKELGLVQTVSDGLSGVDTEVEGLLKHLDNNSPAAISLCKQMLRGVHGPKIDPLASRDLVCSSMANVRLSTEGQEGLMAIIERRSPKWAAM